MCHALQINGINTRPTKYGAKEFRLLYSQIVPEGSAEAEDDELPTIAINAAVKTALIPMKTKKFKSARFLALITSPSSVEISIEVSEIKNVSGR
jgi:hypothetical protein